MRLVFLVVALLGAGVGRAEELLIASSSGLFLDDEGDYSKEPKLLECEYWITTEQADAQPLVSLRKGTGILPVHEALQKAYEGYFAAVGIEEGVFRMRAQATFQRVDDGPCSAVAESLSGRPLKYRNLWFYIVTCDGSQAMGFEKTASPVLVLMDGSLVVARERIESMLEME